MLVVVDPHSGVPVYRQIMDQIRLQAASGILGPGQELPSTRQLSAELGINPMTISKAYSLLEREGLVERRPGLPLVVRGRGEGELVRERTDELVRSLREPARIARQLGVEPERALELFAELLEPRAGSDGGAKGA